MKISLILLLACSLYAQDAKKSFNLYPPNFPQPINDIKLEPKFTTEIKISQPFLGIPKFRIMELKIDIPDCPLNLGVYQSDILRYVKQNFENGLLLAGSVAAVGVEIKDGEITLVKSLEIEGTDPNLSILWEKVIDHSVIINFEQRDSELVLDGRYIIWYKITENFMGINKLKNFVNSKGNIHITLL